MSTSSWTRNDSVNGFLFFKASRAENRNWSDDRAAVSSGRDLRYCTKTRAATKMQNDMNGFICSWIRRSRLGAFLRLTVVKSMWLIIFMIFEIWSAATMHLRLLSVTICSGILFFSALKMAAWCRQMVDVCIAILQKITLGSLTPAGNRRWFGIDKVKWSRILSCDLCRCQYSPLRS